MIGIIYPLPSSFIERVKGKKNFFFIKNAPHESLPLKLEIGKLVLFYCNKTIFAEGKIKNMALQDLNEILKIRKTIQTKEELKEYCGSGFKKFKKQIVFELIDIKVYDPPLICPFSITMTGQYITPEVYNTIRSLSK